ncbi:glycosyltransferase [Vibrio sp. 10N]|uniref:glycosyltransferase n=1 Tax=Vibrio sp. 10N TaxID=3058938 RepID=UPI00281460B3|nr:glycosyltransferase family 1 protein [Vibrio sp. 10N]
MRDLIVFGEDYGALPSSTQHLVKRLATKRKVLWINSIGLRQPRLNTNDFKRALGKILGKGKAEHFQSHRVEHPPSMTIANIHTLPAPRATWSRKLAAKAMAYQLRPMIDELNLNDPIVWTSLPTAADVCALLEQRSVVYYCGDDFGALAGVDHATVLDHEKGLVAQADLVITASEKLCARFPSHKTRLLSHGVDSKQFSTPAPRATDLPDRGRPIAGFYGSLSNWLDYELLNQTIAALPNWDFVFIGQLELSRLPITAADNVFYLGPKPHHELPRYSQHWTVSLLPFVLNEQIKACNPLKLKEYLAARRPVVSTDFPALSGYRQHVNVISDADTMVVALNRIAQESKILPKGLVDNESWDNRASTLELYLEAL